MREDVHLFCFNFVTLTLAPAIVLTLLCVSPICVFFFIHLCSFFPLILKCEMKTTWYESKRIIIVLINCGCVDVNVHIALTKSIHGFIHLLFKLERLFHLLFFFLSVLLLVTFPLLLALPNEALKLIKQFVR